MFLIIVIVLIANAILSHVIAKQGEDRKIGYTNSFLVSFVFSPLIGLLLVIASKELTPEEKEKIKYQENEFVEAKKYIIEKREDSEEPLPFNHTIVIISVIIILSILILATMI